MKCPRCKLDTLIEIADESGYLACQNIHCEDCGRRFSLKAVSGRTNQIEKRKEKENGPEQ